ncbi:PH domain-containing protein [Microbispora sp. RL4-1S]|uniref:PH domain-containing protein n=1 Tax=Microbispora oryzae TaxID=2806554 RepID=A0A941AKD7_9ACTN|nr:PH domain-containing protein [Microbispora oryzae]MBP2705133.1 PH domain-containing protein [Microbispora oryzae]
MSVPEEAGWRRLSARMLVIHPFQEVVRAAPALIGLLFAGSSGGGGGHLWSLGAVAVVVLLGMLRWFTTTYRVTPEHVQVRKGLLHRKVVTVPRDRVRTVDVTSNILHRVFGLARVEVGTGRSDRKRGGELRLDALTAAEAAGLRVELLHRRDAGATASPVLSSASPGAAEFPGAAAAVGTGGEETELAVLRPSWIAFGPFTLSGLVAVGVIAGFVSRLASEGNVDLRKLGPVRHSWDWLGAQSPALAVATVVVVLALFVGLASTIGYLLAFWGFRLTRHTGGTLHVTRGLVTTRATTIEERRMRGVELSEPLLLRAVRGARVIAITTGLRVGQGAQRGGSMLLPPAPRAAAEAVARTVLRGAPEPSPVTAPLRSHGRAALRRRFTRALGVHALIVAIFFIPWEWSDLAAWPWLTAVAVLPLTAVIAADRYRGLGHAIASGHLVSRWGSLVRRRVALECDGVIGWTVERSFFQRRAGLVTLTATTAAGRQGYAVQDVELPEALRLATQGSPGLLDPFLVPAPGTAPGAVSAGPAPAAPLGQG